MRLTILRHILLATLMSFFIALNASATNSFGNIQPYTSFQNILLPHDANNVNTVFQDSRGMIWLGTKRGLFCYNGFDAHRFNSVPIQSIAQTSDDRLFVGADNGLFCFNLRNEEFMPLPEAINELGYIRSLLYDEGLLWIGTRDKGLWRYDTQHDRLTKCNASWQEGTIYSMVRVDNSIFIGAQEGLSVYDFKTQKRFLCDTKAESPRDIYSIYHDTANKVLWLGTNHGLSKYDLRNRDAILIDSMTGICINSVINDLEGNLLMGTDRGLFIWDKNQHIRRVTHDSHNSQSIRNNVILKILCDNNGNFWLATDRGISITRPHLSTTTFYLSQLVNSNSGNVFSSLLHDHHGDYWLGGDNGLIHISSSDGTKTWFSTANTSHPLHNNHIRSIYEDRDGEIWIATDASIARYNRLTGSFEYFMLRDQRGRNTNWSYAIYEDSHGHLWVSTYQSGLYIVDKHELLNSGGDYTLKQDLFGDADDLVKTAYNMIPDEAEENVWLNFGEGLAMVNIETLAAERRDAYLDNFACIGDYIWYSENGVLKRHDISKRETSLTDFGNKEGMIYALVAENDNLWFSTANGIYCLDTQSGLLQNAFITSNQYFTGIYDPECNQMLWGGEDCLISIDLQAISATAMSQSRPTITSVSINGQRGETRDGLSPLFLEELKLTGSRNITFELSTLDYSSPDEINIYYKLDNNAWQALGKGQNKISFATLPYGTSILRLCNTNPEMSPQAKIFSYTLRTPWPFYLSWWMICFYLLALSLAGYMIYRFIQRRNLRRFEQQEKERSLELSRQKMDFFVNMSHELKTPLSLVIAPLGTLIAEISNSSTKDKLKHIYDNALRLSNIVGRIIDFKRMEYESEDILIRSHVEICSLVENCIKAFSTTSAERHINITFTHTVEQLWLNVDLMKIESVLMNLISNAMKYVSNDVGTVTVSLTALPGTVSISVEDNGKGMDEADIPMMAIRFFQGKNANKVGGTGIGFYLVKKFTELHGGTVKTRNHNGLTVTIELPTTGENAIKQPGIAVATTPHNNSEHKPTILIIDDNIEITAFLSETLAASYHCITAYNGAEGLEKTRELMPDLIIVDEMMPVMGGLEYCREVRKVPQMAVIPIIMLTAKNDAQTELDSIKVGVDLFMPKPFDMKKLSLQIVQLLMKQKRMEKAINIQNITNPAFDKEKIPAGRDSDEILLERITSIVEDNMADEDFNVAALSDKLGIDKKQIYRKLTQLTGLTTIAYIKKLRMKKAAVLLQEKRFTISEVMYMVGYSNASYFTRSFVAEFGMTPKQYVAQ